MATEGHEPNRYIEALKEGFNAVGIAGAVAAAAALVTPIPLLVGLVAEAAYLAFVPDSSWYEKRLEARHDAQVRERREQLKREVLPQLRPVLHARWHTIESLREQIAAQKPGGSNSNTKGDTKFVRQVARKLDYLLEKWLHFASREAQFTFAIEEAARAVGADGPEAVPKIQAAYYREAQDLKQQAEAASSYPTRSLLESRAQVLEKRREWIGRVEKLRGDMAFHLELIEDTFALVNDQMRVQAPEMVLADLERLAWQLDTTSELLNELGPLDASRGDLPIP